MIFLDSGAPDLFQLLQVVVVHVLQAVEQIVPFIMDAPMIDIQVVAHAAFRMRVNDDCVGGHMLFDWWRIIVLSRCTVRLNQHGALVEEYDAPGISALMQWQADHGKVHLICQGS